LNVLDPVIAIHIAITVVEFGGGCVHFQPPWSLPAERWPRTAFGRAAAGRLTAYARNVNSVIGFRTRTPGSVLWRAAAKYFYIAQGRAGKFFKTTSIHLTATKPPPGSPVLEWKSRSIAPDDIPMAVFGRLRRCSLVDYSANAGAGRRQVRRQDLFASSPGKTSNLIAATT
jgi:hypothetical protein